MRTFKREILMNHLAKCDHTLIPCKYRKLGCPVSKKRRDMSAHEEGSDKFHLHKALDAMRLVAKDHAITFKTSSAEVKGYCGKSPTFYTSSCGYHLSIEVRREMNFWQEMEDFLPYYSFVVHVFEGKYDSQLEWPIVGTLTITLLNQIENENHMKTIINFTQKDNFSV